ncbi:MAG: triose-phosphate isomerase [Candidatus Paceibacterota bacterium]
MRKTLVVGNWKMYPLELSDARKLLEGVKKGARNLSHTEAVICPPFIYIQPLRGEYRGKKVGFGAQDVFWEREGSFTGEVSAPQLRDIDVEYVIVGHSERRALGESDEMVNKKVKSVLKAELTPILCFGEKKHDKEGEYLDVISDQLTSCLDGIRGADAAHIVFAYEPIWAIGGDADSAMTPHEIHQMALFIRKVLRELYDNAVSTKARILYGGSVESTNTPALMEEANVDGFLVGHASLNATHFNNILEAVEEYHG